MLIENCLAVGAVLVFSRIEGQSIDVHNHWERGSPHIAG